MEPLCGVDDQDGLDTPELARRSRRDGSWAGCPGWCCSWEPPYGASGGAAASGRVGADEGPALGSPGMPELLRVSVSDAWAWEAAAGDAWWWKPWVWWRWKKECRGCAGAGVTGAGREAAILEGGVAGPGLGGSCKVRPAAVVACVVAAPDPEAGPEAVALEAAVRCRVLVSTSSAATAVQAAVRCRVLASTSSAATAVQAAGSKAASGTGSMTRPAAHPGVGGRPGPPPYCGSTNGARCSGLGLPIPGEPPLPPPLPAHSLGLTRGSVCCGSGLLDPADLPSLAKQEVLRLACCSCGCCKLVEPLGTACVACCSFVRAS